MFIFTFTLCAFFTRLISFTYGDITGDFNTFLKKYHHFLSSDRFNRSFENFQRNYWQQLQLNKTHKYPSAFYGPTKFSHLSPEEFRDQYLTDLKVKHKLPIPSQQLTPLHTLKQLNIPERIDWRNYSNKNYVTPIKNQKKCGACWAFSATETVESAKAIKTELPPIALSVQEVIDCATYNSGCSGGDPYRALKWLEDTNSPLTTEKKYPLTDTSDFCRIITNNSDGVRVKSCSSTSYVGNENEILKLLTISPVSVAVDASTWNNYMGGIIQYHCEQYINHAVQIVGYDISGDIPYYIVRNSWGADYGDKGYMYIKIGNNLCGIAEEVTSVTVY